MCIRDRLCVAQAQSNQEAAALVQALQTSLAGMQGVSCEVLTAQQYELAQVLPPPLPCVQESAGSALQLGQRVLCAAAEEAEPGPGTILHVTGDSFCVVQDDGLLLRAVPRTRLRQQPRGGARATGVPLEHCLPALELHSQHNAVPVSRIQVDADCQDQRSAAQHSTLPEVGLEVRWRLKCQGAEAETQPLPDSVNLVQALQMLRPAEQPPLLARKHELQYEILPVLQAQAPDELLGDESKAELVRAVQLMGSTEWKHRMGLLGSAQLVAATNQPQRLLGLHAALCAAPEEAAQLEARTELLLAPPADTLEARLQLCGLGSQPAQHAAQLLWLLHTRYGEQHPGLCWVSQALSAKLQHQLEQPVPVSAQVLPAWCTALPSVLLSFAARRDLFECSSYGAAHSVYWAQQQLDRVQQLQQQEQLAQQSEFLASVQASQLSEAGSEHSKQQAEMVLMQAQAVSVEIRERIRELQLGTLSTQMAKLPDLKDSAALQHVQALFAQHCGSRAVLELSQARDQAFGSGVTQECYTCTAALLMSHSFNTRQLVFLPCEPVGSGPEALLEVPPEGLFPRAVLCPVQRSTACSQWEFLGQLLGRALRDGYTVPLPLSTAFFKLVLGQTIGEHELPPPRCPWPRCARWPLCCSSTAPLRWVPCHGVHWTAHSPRAQPACCAASRLWSCASRTSGSHTVHCTPGGSSSV
eukprot:TRINITY_DN27968_c0_g2_i2.p1 TRINITY_DN27968_c0_g2~~TRINITY_DN27968_c0_g2_i2.p1  ORF type:complete len:697 (+),score=273.41 TRINITY_DN27968_c0_g2_i2:144-2234(+)